MKHNQVNKILVAIASYGTANDRYLAMLLSQYRAMSFEVTIVVFSNLPKELGQDVKVVVGLPTRNPWSLPHAHKKLFVEAVKEFDLFIYSEDDHLITEHNVIAFLEATAVLSDAEIAGFLVSETDESGSLTFPAIHGPYHWDPFSVRQRGEDVFASFTNEHSASYMVTQKQLMQAIASGGFMVPPHSGKYDLLCSAATDIYTQCGFEKVICISRLKEFTFPHLPNKYVGRLGVSGEELKLQVAELMRIARGEQIPSCLLDTDSSLSERGATQPYYEAARMDVVALVPPSANTVLALGCGWGATEKVLLERGFDIVVVPLDSVVAVSAEARGLKVMSSDWKTARQALEGQRFDCVLCLSTMHLIPNADELLRDLAGLLTPGGTLILGVPNRQQWQVLWNRFKGLFHKQAASKYPLAEERMGTRSRVLNWLAESRVKVSAFVPTGSRRARLLSQISGGTLRRYLEAEILVVGTRT